MESGEMWTTFRRMLKLSSIVFSCLLIIANFWMLEENGVDMDFDFKKDGLCALFTDMMPIHNIILGLFIILGESGTDFAINYAGFLKPWLGRGLFMVFVATMTGGVCLKDQNDSLKTLKTCAGLGIFFVGLIYTGMGLLCLKRLTEGVTDHRKPQPLASNDSLEESASAGRAGKQSGSYGSTGKKAASNGGASSSSGASQKYKASPQVRAYFSVFSTRNLQLFVCTFAPFCPLHFSFSYVCVPFGSFGRKENSLRVSHTSELIVP